MDESLFELARDRMKELKLDVFYKWHDSLYSYISFAGKHSRNLHTDNVTQRCNKELKRRTRKIGTFSNSDSVTSLFYV